MYLVVNSMVDYNTVCGLLMASVPGLLRGNCPLEEMFFVVRHSAPRLALLNSELSLTNSDLTISGRLTQVQPQALSRPRALLTYIAGPTVVEKVTDYLLQAPTGYEQTQINRLENLLCLFSSHREEYGHGLFVLEPVGDLLAGLDPNGQLIPGDDERQDRDDAEEGDAWQSEVYRTPAIPRSGERRRWRRTAEILETGFTFSLTTPDPVDYPLPHPDLLCLHATLMRVARAAGTTATEEDEFFWSNEEVVEQERQGESTDEDLSYPLSRFLEGTVLQEDHREDF
ncbi:hypothetical protein BGX38DRAFT_1145892 [Terfezia claveryi]|nr:hypothetical protein BGX38DRAFT_1145892 [Terfezia claveryi]